MISLSQDDRTLCPVCRQGKLSRNTSSSLLGLVTRTYVECNKCGAAFLKVDEKYCLDEIKDERYPNWQKYHHQILTVREWSAISRGGYSDQEQKQIDIDDWLQQLASGAVSIPSNVQSNVVLNPNEKMVLAIPDVIFSEPRAVRETSGTYGGPSIRIATGLTWRMGGFKAKSESHDELRNIDTGILTITSTRLVFSGPVKTIRVKLKDLISIEPYDDGIAISKEGKERPAFFTNIDKHKITASVSGRTYEIPLNGLILKILIEREI